MLYSLQNLKYFFRALRAGCYNFYKTSKFSSALRAGGYIFYKILNFFRASRGEVIFFTKSAAKIYRFLNVFRTVSALITAKNPKNFRALRAQGFGIPKKFPRFARGCYIFLQNPLKKSRASRGMLYFLQNPPKNSPARRTKNRVRQPSEAIFYKNLKK